ncbi:MAG: hypothetical protein EAZ89_03920 [Bacteroidetes bacterium]|nr:MAG: hypothetical protein EAZ89_03920 [Bacteroidota bacterium]
MSLFLLQVPLRLPDGGPIYTETDTSRFIVEPWNGLSAAFFLLIVVYWLSQIRGQWRKHGFMTAALPVLAVGGVGGTIYHAFRLSRVFLLMDFLPIVILCLCASVYFFVWVTGKWWLALLMIASGLTLSGLMFQFAERGGLPASVAITVNYAIMGAFILLPIGWLLLKTHFRHGRWVGYALGAFLLALLFRWADPQAWLPMGTHFLWHTFGAIACHCVLAYVFWLNEDPEMLSAKRSSTS